MLNFISKTKDLLLERVANIDVPPTESVLIGRNFEAVLLKGTLGVCYGPREPTPTCTAFSKPGTLKKTDAKELLELVDSPNSIQRAIGISALNALSQWYILNNNDRYIRTINKDILEILPIDKDTKVGMVGKIGPFIKFLKAKSKKLVVVDDNPNLSPQSQKQGFILTRNIEDIEDSDILIITGSTVTEHSLERPLSTAKDANYRAVIGPTASWIPDIAFEMGFDVVCGMTFTNPKLAFEVIMEGGGTRQFSKHADKYILSKDSL